MKVPTRHAVVDAERLFRQMIDPALTESAIPPFETITAALRRFVTTDFEVDEENDGDGFLFEYGVFEAMPDPGFILGFVRQLDVVDADGDHEYYLQLRTEYRYPIDRELTAAGRNKSWWFKDCDHIPFDQWLDEVLADPIWPLLARKSATSFTLKQEEI